jgi:hypothetical protein
MGNECEENVTSRRFSYGALIGPMLGTGVETNQVRVPSWDSFPTEDQKFCLAYSTVPPDLRDGAPRAPVQMQRSNKIHVHIVKTYWLDFFVEPRLGSDDK